MAKTDPETFLGGEPELEQAQAASDEKVLAKQEDQKSSANERELALLKEKIQEERAAREKLEASIKLWRDGDISKLPADSQFEVTVHQDDNDIASQIVRAWVNGVEFAFKRGEPKIVPRYVVDVLSRAVVDAWVKLVDPVTDNPNLVRVQRRRFDFSARPIFSETSINA